MIAHVIIILVNQLLPRKLLNGSHIVVPLAQDAELHDQILEIVLEIPASRGGISDFPVVKSHHLQYIVGIYIIVGARGVGPVSSFIKEVNVGGVYFGAVEVGVGHLPRADNAIFGFVQAEYRLRVSAGYTGDDQQAENDGENCTVSFHTCCKNGLLLFFGEFLEEFFHAHSGFFFDIDAKDSRIVELTKIILQHYGINVTKITKVV